MKNPRILILENSIAVTGGLTSIVRSSSYMRDRYDFVFVLPAKSKGVTFVKQHDFPVREFRMREISRRLSSLVFYIPTLLYNVMKFRSFIRRERIDLIVNNDFYNMLPPLYRFLGGQIPYVTFVRFMPGRFPKLLVNLWQGMHVRFATNILAVSNAVKRELPFHTGIEVIRHELPEGSGLDSPGTSRVILYPANYISGKGQQHALAAFALIFRNYPDWKLRFVGGDMGVKKNAAFKTELIRQANALGLGAQVEWKGFSANMKEEYEAASIVLMFSESESFSLTCMEGLFYCRAVIATRCGGPEEIIRDGQSGMLVPKRDISQMAATIEKLIREPALRESLSREGRRSILEHFSYDKTIVKLAEAYQKALGLPPDKIPIP